MTSPAALDILRRARLPSEARSTAVRGTHKATGSTFYLWDNSKTGGQAAALFAPEDREPFTIGAFESHRVRELMLSRAFDRLQETSSTKEFKRTAEIDTILSLVRPPIPRGAWRPKNV